MRIEVHIIGMMTWHEHEHLKANVAWPRGSSAAAVPPSLHERSPSRGGPPAGSAPSAAAGPASSRNTGQDRPGQQAPRANAEEGPPDCKRPGRMAPLPRQPHCCTTHPP